MDVFNYSDHFLHRVVQAYDISRPIQIELHPGIHCDLYRCPHCYGHGQRPMPGAVISPDEIGAALDEVSSFAPTIIVSGITTEPLTHPQAAGIISHVRRRGMPLGLYTKGLRLEGDIAAALLDGSGECFVTVSLDDARKDVYMTRHGLPIITPDRKDRLPGADYYERVLNNVSAFKAMRDARGVVIDIRIALLLFADSCDKAKVISAVHSLEGVADRVRIAFPQDRNDGKPPGLLPADSSAILKDLKEHFADNPNVRIIEETADPHRNPFFQRCRAQRFQVVIDKSGNVFPCPQVAVGAYRHLCCGNIRERSFSDLLVSEDRRRLFEMDVDTQMNCRICDRKDEAVNVALHHLASAYK